MTSTSFNVGLGEDPRSSSRVLRPPGGGHTDIFGGDPEPPRGRRLNPAAASATSLGEQWQPQNGNALAHNGQEATAPAPTPEAVPQTEAPAAEPAKPEPVKPAQAAPEAPKRVRVPPASPQEDKPQPGLPHSRMEGGRRQMRLLGRLLSKLRGSNNLLEKQFPTSSGSLFPNDTASNSESTMTDDEDTATSVSSSRTLDDAQFAAKIDLRYSGQYLTPEQLPEFCNQLHHLVEVIRNIQSYAKITGEYPSELERRLEEEARELAALAAEARNARDVVARARAQRRAVRAQRKQLVAHLASLKETETRELENSIRLADRKLYLSWEALKESTDPAALESFLDEVKNKQIALENLVRLIECRQSSLARNPSPGTLIMNDKSDDQSSGAGKKRFDGSKRSFKRKRAREPRSVPLSGEPSRHGPQQQDSESTTRYSVGSAGAVALPPLELPSRGSYRDIIFFTVN